MVLLCLAGSFIWWLPWWTEIFYVPVQEAFGFSHTQIGILTGTAGFASLATYIPGGWVADRFPARKLMSTSLVISAMGGFVFAGIPSFEVCLVLYGLWGASVALIFWAAMIKTTRNWGRRDEQGRAFGILEGGRGFVDAITTFGLLGIFAYLGANSAALSTSIHILSASMLAMAALIWVVMKDEVAPSYETQGAKAGFSWTSVVIVMKMPVIWLLSLVILGTNYGLWGTVYFTPYATDIYELGSIGGGAVGAGKYAVAAVVAVAAGFIADRIGAARAVVGLFVFMTAGYLLFALVPGAPGLVPMLLINAVIVTVALFALRGIYYALLEQGGVPVSVTGTAAGLVAAIGYTPDAIAPIFSGLILDAYPRALGYQVLFAVICGLCFIGLIAAIFIYRTVQASNQVHG